LTGIVDPDPALMNEQDLELLNFEERIEKKVVEVLTNQGLSDVRESEDYTNTPREFSRVVVEINGAKDELFRKPNGDKEFMYYEATINIDHFVTHSQQNTGKLKARMKITRGVFLRKHFKQFFTPAFMSPYKFETLGPPKETNRADFDERQKHDVASMSWDVSFSINPDSWSV